MYSPAKQMSAPYFRILFRLYRGEDMFTFVSLAQMTIVVLWTVHLALNCHNHTLSSPSYKKGHSELLNYTDFFHRVDKVWLWFSHLRKGFQSHLMAKTYPEENKWFFCFGCRFNSQGQIVVCSHIIPDDILPFWWPFIVKEHFYARVNKLFILNFHTVGSDEALPKCTWVNLKKQQHYFERRVT